MACLTTFGNTLEEARILVRHGDRVSFSHELFLDAFAGESTIRTSGSRVEAIRSALRAPVHAGRKDMILGAIDDERVLRALLPQLDDRDCARVCLAGKCGRRALEWAQARCAEVVRRMEHEARQVRFQVTGDLGSVEFDCETVGDRDAWEEAFLGVLPEVIWQGEYLEDVLMIVGTMDRRLRDEGSRLRAEGRSARGGLPDHLFQCAYVLVGPTHPRVSAVADVVQSGVLGLLEPGSSVRGKLAKVVADHGMGDDLTPGQIYLILHLGRWDEPCRGFIARTIRERWSSLPYHLRLELLTMARMANPANDDDRRSLVDALETLPDQGFWLQSMVLEALQALGVLNEDEEEHRGVARAEVESCLAQDGEDAWEDAWRLYVCQFDHPFSGAYWEAIHDLPTGRQMRLLAMAAKGAQRSSFFVDTLLVTLVTLGGRDVCEVLVPWTQLPPQDSVALWDAVRPFLIAHVGLANLRCELPIENPNKDPRELAMAAYGALLYWINRTDMPRDGRVTLANRRCVRSSRKGA